jgi:uncharacterized Zn finger protein
MEIKMKCPKCQSDLLKGIVKGSSGHDNGQKWGLEMDWDGTVKSGIAVETYRCEKCGYLESYAK